MAITTPVGVNLGVIGCGNLGGALVRGLVDAKLLTPKQIFVFDKSTEKMRGLELLGVQCCPDETAVAAAVAVLVIAVKPHHVVELLDLIRPTLEAGGATKIISVAAGTAIAQISSHLPKSKTLVRVMPNLPAVVRAGICGIYGADKESVETAAEIFSALGRTVVMEKEEHLDVVTALSAGGPAFASVFVAGLIDGGCAMGLPPAQARELALHMLRGTAELLLAQGLEPDKLIEQVATPNGTTMAGLKEFEKGKLRALAATAIVASTERAREIRDGK